MTDDIRYERMLTIEKRYGNIEPDFVVEDARDPKSPYHDDFNWNVEEVAWQAWRQTARRIIRDFSFEKIRRKVTIICPMFRHDPAKGNEQGYVLLPETMGERKYAMARQELRRAYGVLYGSWTVLVAMDSDESDEQLVWLEKEVEKLTKHLWALLQTIEPAEEESA